MSLLHFKVSVKGSSLSNSFVEGVPRERRVSKFEVKVSKSLFVDQMNVCDLKSALSPCPRLTTVLCVQLSLLLATCRGLL